MDRKRGRRAAGPSAISRVWLSAQPFQRENSFQILCRMERKWCLCHPLPLPLVLCKVPSSTPLLWKGTQSFKVRFKGRVSLSGHLPTSLKSPEEDIYTASFLQVPCTDSLRSTPEIPCRSSFIWHLSELNSLSCSIEGF